MRSSLFYWAAVPAFMLVYSCQAGRSYARDEQVQTVSDSTTVAQREHNMLSLTSAERKRIRSADFRCRVNNVQQTSERVERLVRSLNGVVEESTQQNEYRSSKDIRYKPDSIKRVQLYTTTSNIRLRVPVTHLDSVVYTLSALSSFVDARKLSDKDASLLYLSNELQNESTPAPVLAPTRNDKAIDMNAVQADKTAEAVHRKIENLQIREDVAYSTITLQLYQPETADVQVLVNPDYVTSTPFATASLNALRDGAGAVLGFAVVLIALWPLWILAGLGYWGYRRFGKKVLAG
ncbi:DUF4349 domain-containing protein [uncultured Chitinophaga sp.]|uniref:DUF4349 domain-containing protein n=1 Tax=uncultured Chitinophaga sp. TaxID=339340 RepID=UPI0025CE9ABB|nr:DUF4349 domain-containing protein [uncultured Chitinophaga sp.]